MTRLAVLHQHTSALAPSAARSAWDRLPKRKREVAQQRHVVVEMVLKRCTQGASAQTAIDHILAHADVDEALADVRGALHTLSRANKLPSKASIYRWVGAFREGGLYALAPNHRGGNRTDYGWEARALHFYTRPSAPAISAVARWLREEGYDSATEPRVRRYLNGLPEDIKQRGRLGTRLYKATQAPYTRRETQSLDVGALYMGDGHTCDVYVEHPATGKPFRPELTIWIDVRSRYVAGWWLSESESAQSTIFALSHALMSHDHIPHGVYVDNGSGYKSKMMNDESAGFYGRFGIGTTFSLPYNAKAKGHVERFFRTFEDDLGKRFSSYCGHDVQQQALHRVLNDARRGAERLPSLAMYRDSIATWFERYHNEPHRGLKSEPLGNTPAEVWSHLNRFAVEPRDAAVFWPRVERVISRASVKLHNREYENAELLAYNGKRCIVEYNLHDDQVVRIIDEQGRWICDAALIHKQPMLPESRIEEQKQKRLEGQLQRLQARTDEAERRARITTDHSAALSQLETEAQLLEANDEGSEKNRAAEAAALIKENSEELTIDLNLFAEDGV